MKSFITIQLKQQSTFIFIAALCFFLMAKPAHSSVMFQYQIPSDDQSDPINTVILVTDATGRAIKSFNLTDPLGLITTDITTFTPGVYFVTLVTNRHPAITKKLLIMRN